MDSWRQAQSTFVMTKLRTLLRKNCVSIFAVLLLLFVGTTCPCPPTCYLCTVHVAQCEHISSLSEVVVGLSSHTEKILLQHGNVSEIPPLSFTKFPRLHFLSITGCPISSLDDLTFFTIHVNSLRVLNLSNNHLFSCMIKPMAFSGLVFLHELILTNNSLDTLRRSWFLEMPVLIKLHLGANRITYLPPRIFENLTKLNELVVSSNLIQYLPMDTFYGVPLLTKLDLSNNRILFINHEVFQPLQALKYLLLFQNRLTILPILPSSISFLFLHQNSWECTCQLVISMKPLLAKIQYPDGVTCDGPPSLAGHQVTSTRLEGCSFQSQPLSSSSSLPPSSPLSSTVTATHIVPSEFWNLSLLYGILGGTLIGFATCLIFCCCCPLRRCCNCPHFQRGTETKKTDKKKMTPLLCSEKKSSDMEPRVLCSFPVAENSAVGFEAGCMGRGTSYGCSSETTRTCRVEQMKSASQKPLVAVLSVDAAGKAVVTLCEAAREIGCPALEQPSCQMHGGTADGIHAPPACEQRGNKVAACVAGCSSEPKCSANREHGSCNPYLQRAASSQTERKNCAAEKSVDRQTPHPGSQPGVLQCPQALLHINFLDGSAPKIEIGQERDCETSSKRKGSQGSGFHLHDSRRWLATRRNSSSLQKPGHHYQACFMPPQSSNAPQVKLWPDGLVGRRHPKHTTRSAASARKIDPYALSASKANERQEWKSLHDHCPLPTCATISSSSTSTTPSRSEENGLTQQKEPSLEMLSVAHHPGTRERSPQPLDDVSKARKRPLAHGKARHSQQDPTFALTRDTSLIQRDLKCLRCGCEDASAHSAAQRTPTQWNPSPRTSRRRLDVITQQSSTDTIRLKGCEMTLACLGPEENDGKMLPDEPGQSRGWPALPPPIGISQRERSASEAESTCEDPSPPAVSAVPFTEMISAQLSLENKGGTVGTVANGSVDAHSPRDTGSGEETLDAEGTLETIPLGIIGQCSVEGERDTSGAYSNVMLSEPCYDVSAGLLFRIKTDLSMLETSVSCKSSSERSYSDAQGDGYEEVSTTITSCCPVVQKMCQIDFPLLGEEEELRKHKKN